MKNQTIKFVALCAIVFGTCATASAQVPSAPAVPSTPSVLATIQPAVSNGVQAVKADAAQAAKATNAAQGVEARLNKLKTSLNLTDDQTAKVKTLLVSEAVARKSGDRQAIKDNHQKMTSEMGTILTPDQLAKYKQMMMPAKKAVQPAK